MNCLRIARSARDQPGKAGKLLLDLGVGQKGHDGCCSRSCVEPPAAILQPAECILPRAPRRLIVASERLLDDEAMILLSGRLQRLERALVRLLPAEPACARLRHRCWQYSAGRRSLRRQHVVA